MTSLLDERLLTVEDVAKILRCSVGTVYNRVADGCPCITTSSGGWCAFHPDDIAAYRESCAVKPVESYAPLTLAQVKLRSGRSV